MQTLRLGIAVMLLGFTQKSHASLVLTAAGIADGFSLSVFASGIPNNGSYGPMGTATTSSGNVLVTDFGGSPPGVFSWPDVDGQTPGSALGFASVGTSNFGITNAQGKIYSVDFGAGNINLLNNDGSLNSIFLALPGGTNGNGNGITTNPVNGHIYVDSGNGINDIDPATKSVRHINSVLGDGITVSPDGSTVYVAVGGSLVAYNTTSGLPTGFSVAISGADGVGIIQPGTSPFSNFLVVNTNGGLVDLINPAGTSVVTIANGGSRGDFVGVDNNNGTLFLSQTDSVDRLSCGPGCGFAPPTTPEPAAGTLTLVGLGWLIRRRILSGVRFALGRSGLR